MKVVGAVLMETRTGPLPARLKSERPMRVEQKRGVRGRHLLMATRHLPLWLGIRLCHDGQFEQCWFSPEKPL